MSKRNFEYFCDDFENIENYDKAKADNFKGWCCHHRLQTHTSDGERRLVNITSAELIALGMYYNRPANELIFLTRKEHGSLHNKGNGHCKGKHWKLSKETRNRMSEANKRNPRKAFLGKHHSEETKRKMSEAHKGKPNGLEGKHWKIVDGKRVYY